MTVGVLGGGLQGCCVALALAHRGQPVVLFDRRSGLLTRTAIANEGKIHLGWMYAADPTLATARTMMQGALAFSPFLERYLGTASSNFATSQPAAYAIHRESQHETDEVEAYFAAVHRLVQDAWAREPSAYFGKDLSRVPRKWSDAEREAVFDPSAVLAAFDTPEIAIDPVELAVRMRKAISEHPRIELRLEHEVEGASECDRGVEVVTRSGGTVGREQFDHVVNALWEGRLAIDQLMGHGPDRPWLHRLKYGVSFGWPEKLMRPPSVTFVSGPFGEVVSYPDLTTYLTWYPACVLAYSNAVVPPDWVTYPTEPLLSEIVKNTFGGLAESVRALRGVEPVDLKNLHVKGGGIVAWGKTDIDDPQSELHKRYEIGVHTWGRYHSVDPGKLTMAPYFAERCASRITAAT